MKNQKQPTNLDKPVLFSRIDWESEPEVLVAVRNAIFEAVSAVYPDVAKTGKKLAISIEHPGNFNYGDFSTSIAFQIASKVRKNPREVAEKVASRVNQYIERHQTITYPTDSKYQKGLKKLPKSEKAKNHTFSEIFEKAHADGPGFINLWIRKELLITELVEVLNRKNFVRSRKNTVLPAPPVARVLRKKKIMVEFAHPNTHKEFHIGHLRNITLGESITRILESTGARLFRANYEGDVGLHVAKAIWGVRIILKRDRLDIESVRVFSPREKANFLGRGYALGSKVYEEDEDAKKAIIKLNKTIYLDPKQVELWEETRSWSLDYFDSVYKRLGTHFDRLFFESEAEKPGRKMVEAGLAKGLFIKDPDGSIYFPGEKYGLNNCVFVTQENYATYEGKDVALESMEYEVFPYDLDIHVVAHEQKNFFEIAFKALELLSPVQKGKQFHLAYGMVNLKGSKLSSRSGHVITADYLIDEAKKKIKEIMKRTSVKAIELSSIQAVRDSNSAENAKVEEIAENVAVASVKYSMLRVNPKMDIAFDLEESVSLEGDSGPYLLYTYARCRSVMSKAGLSDLSLYSRKSRTFLKSLTGINEEENLLLRTLYRFPESVIHSAKTLSPNLLCSFLFDLSQKFNLFYNKHSILTPEVRNQKSEVGQPTTHNPSFVPNKGGPQDKQLTTNFRLFLTTATAEILQEGLTLLGIPTVESM